MASRTAGSIVAEIHKLDTPADLELEVRSNPKLYPSIERYNTLVKATNRFELVSRQLQKTKNAVLKQRYMNELEALAGKKYILSLKNAGPLDYLVYLRADIRSADVTLGLGSTPDIKEERRRHVASNTAMYLHAGRLLRSMQ
jgi:hypothetical protein